MTLEELQTQIDDLITADAANANAIVGLHTLDGDSIKAVEGIGFSFQSTERVGETVWYKPKIDGDVIVAFLQ